MGPPNRLPEYPVEEDARIPWGDLKPGVLTPPVPHPSTQPDLRKFCIEQAMKQLMHTPLCYIDFAQMIENYILTGNHQGVTDETS